MSERDNYEAGMNYLNERIAELETALTDALYAWGLVSERAYDYAIAGGIHGPEMREYQEALERIQRARLALPKAQEATG